VRDDNQVESFVESSTGYECSSPKYSIHTGRRNACGLPCIFVAPDRVQFALHVCRYRVRVSRRAKGDGREAMERVEALSPAPGRQCRGISLVELTEASRCCRKKFIHWRSGCSRGLHGDD